jgi:hypothetical protein
MTMSTDVLDRMIGEADALSPDEKRQLRDVLDESLRQDELNKRAALVRSIKGKYAHLGLSSDAFAAAKAEEIELEERGGKI